MNVFRSRRHRRDRVRSTIVAVVLIIFGAVTIVPFVWALSQALQTNATAFSTPPIWITPKPTLENFARVFDLVPFAAQIFNSILVTAAVVFGSIAVATLAAYPLARLSFAGKEVVFGFFIAAILIPSQVTVIPVFLLLRYLGLIDSLGGLIVPGLVQVTGIFLLRQHFKSVPQDMTDSALIDGASHMRILRSIVLPTAWPSLSAMAVFVGQTYWNDFFWPNILIVSPEKMTLPIGLFSLQEQHTSGPPGVVFAAVVMILAPMFVFFVLMQKRLSAGISLVGVNR